MTGLKREQAVTDSHVSHTHVFFCHTSSVYVCLSTYMGDTHTQRQTHECKLLIRPFVKNGLLRLRLRHRPNVTIYVLFECFSFICYVFISDYYIGSQCEEICFM